MAYDYTDWADARALFRGVKASLAPVIGKYHLFLFGLKTVGGVMTVRRYAHLVVGADSIDLVTRCRDAS